ncbi:copper chaperone PCu(A)C [Aestuariicella hydrocarbonica]|uniref:Copper chaperone PCu(A)C n=1 Tax=Pseudomaricurvus hydrocarbonicus TaxID=1470433 RepID=A0A9E5T4P2_9GAMM|nr:copper chaperone PCu(A)C [Aestuariicella hydrocarbonica]
MKEGMMSYCRHSLLTGWKAGLVMILCSFLSVFVDAAELASGSGKAQVLENVHIEEARIRLPLPGQSTAVVYLTLLNLSSQELVIKGVKVEGAQFAELHQHLHRDGMMQMRAVPQVDVSAGGALEFKPGGYHIMAFRMQPGAAEDATYQVSLMLTSGLTLTAQATVIR